MYFTRKLISLQVVVLFLLIQSVISETICNRDEECDTANQYLCIQNKCRCKTGYRLNTHNNCVYVLGTTCSNSEDCENFPGSICESNKCVCENGSLANVHECRRIGQLQDPCNSDHECISRTNDNNLECKEQKCICKSGFHQNAINACILNKDLNDSCSKAEECYQEVNNENSLTCTGGICKCKAGYVEKGNRCNGSTHIYSASLLSLLIIAVGLFKF